MDYRKFKADYLFTGHEILNSDHVLIADRDGRILDIVPKGVAGENIEALHGIISPGFINCHCHLELSHMKGLIPEKKGLVDFLFTVVTQRHFPEQEILVAIAKAEDEMIDNGIVAVGDICNNTNTILQKQKGRLIYHNFIEVSGWLPQVAETRFSRSKLFYDEYTKSLSPGDLTSISPHAPYSVSNALWNLMEPFFKNKIITIHNQETPFEDEFFTSGTGDFQRMYKLMNIDTSFFQPPGKSSLQSCLSKMKSAKQLLLVHDTFTKEDDLQFLSGDHHNHLPEIYFCLCVNANQYIEETLPPIELFRKYRCDIVLGTDSLASNHSLSILDEIKTIYRHFPTIPISELLQWSTINGAKALGIDDTFGSFSKGKKPGIILIENANESALSKESSVKRIL